MERTLILDSEARPRPEGLLRPERLGELFDAHHGRLYRLARRLSGDPEEARDLVQEAFLRAARRPAGLPVGGSGAEAWLVRILVNLCRDRARRLRVRARRTADLPVARDPDPESAAVARATVEAALAMLSPRRRAVIVLHELEGRDVAAIARLLGIAKVTVRWHLAAGRRGLREDLLATTRPERRHAHEG